jgi:hypothetical protein
MSADPRWSGEERRSVNESSIDWKLGQITQILKDQDRREEKIQTDITTINDTLATVKIKDNNRDVEIKSVREEILETKRIVVDLVEGVREVKGGLQSIAADRKAIIQWASVAVVILTFVGKLVVMGFDFVFKK